MNAPRLLVPFVVLLLLAAAAAADEQQFRLRADDVFVETPPIAFQVLESAPLESISTVKTAPFSADAVTEFTQTLGDGNRIERRYASSIARDSRGRTRREEEIALVGPLGATGPAPRLVTILDPDAGVSYTLDESTRVAYRNSIAQGKVAVMATRLDAAASAAKAAVAGGGGRCVVARAPLAVAEAGKTVTRLVDPAASVTVESLGTRSIEGVRAEGSRTTSTI